MGNRLRQLAELMRERGPGRPVSTAAERALGRGTAILPTWAHEEAAIAPLLEAHKLAPEDPRPLNALATALLRKTAQPQVPEAAKLLQRAHETAPRYVPAALNLAHLFEQDGQHEVAAVYRDAAVERLADASWSDVDGVLLPLSFCELCIGHAGRLAEALRQQDLQPLLDFLRPAPARINAS